MLFLSVAAQRIHEKRRAHVPEENYFSVGKDSKYSCLKKVGINVCSKTQLLTYTSKSRSETVVIPIQQSIQDPRDVIQVDTGVTVLISPNTDRAVTNHTNTSHMFCLFLFSTKQMVKRKAEFSINGSMCASRFCRA